MEITREMYKSIKGFNRIQLQQFLTNLQNEAFNNGVSAMSKELAERVDTGIRKTEGIGQKRYEALMANINAELTRDEVTSE